MSRLTYRPRNSKQNSASEAIARIGGIVSPRARACGNGEGPTDPRASALPAPRRYVVTNWSQRFSYSWCRQEKSNPRPAGYESAALPSELYRRSIEP